MNIFYCNFYLYEQWTNHHQAVLTSPLCMSPALLDQWELKASTTKWDDDQSYDWWLDDLLKVVVPQSCGTCQSRHTGLQRVALAYYQELKYTTLITNRTTKSNVLCRPYVTRQGKIIGSPYLCKYTINFPVTLTYGWVDTHLVWRK
jgi:hypothetical protein